MIGILSNIKKIFSPHLSKQGIEGIDYIIDDRYYCKSCGSHTHRCDYYTGRCYECDADDWEPELDKLGECL